MNLRILILLALQIYWISSCKTLVKNPGESRENHPLSIGSGILYTPKKTTGFGLAVNVDSLKSAEQVTIRPGSKGSSSYSVNSEATDDDLRKVTSQAFVVDFMSLYFPWDKSSFFVGALGQARHSRNAYREWRRDYQLSKKTTNVEWEDNSFNLGAVVGLNLRYDDMTSFTFGTALGRRVLNQRRFLDHGNSDQVDLNLRSKTLSSYDSYRERLSPMYLGMLTYSFKP